MSKYKKDGREERQFGPTFIEGLTATEAHMSGFWWTAVNCSSILSPPSTRAALRPVNFPSSLENLKVCEASSRVGDRITARTPICDWRGREIREVGEREITRGRKREVQLCMSEERMIRST